MGQKPETCPYTRLERRKSLIRAVTVYLIVQRTSQAGIFAAAHNLHFHRYGLGSDR
jgi:hypothetical protein